jgi:Protein of unknown function (DUF2924)
MARSVSNVQPALAPAEAIEEKLARIGAMTIEQLRAAWRETFASDPPVAFSKDFFARAISYRVQEEALGRLSASTARLLRSLINPGAEAPRQVKVGSIIVREHNGVLHEALVVPGGFCWQGQTYDSLSTIAKKITGTSWNGPRFFGLRSKKEVPETASPQKSPVKSPPPRSGGRRSSVAGVRTSGATS